MPRTPLGDAAAWLRAGHEREITIRWSAGRFEVRAWAATPAGWRDSKEADPDLGAAVELALKAARQRGHL